PALPRRADRTGGRARAGDGSDDRPLLHRGAHLNLHCRGTRKRSIAQLALCAALALQSCTKQSPDVLILNYHRIGASADYFSVDEAAFAAQLDLIREMGFVTTSFADYLEGRSRRP